LPAEEGSPVFAMVVSAIVFLGGAISGFALYRGKSKDPITVPLFENRFYIDEFYGALVKWTQDLLADISGFIDRWIIDGAARGLSGLTWGVGFALRFLQIGNLQAYSFLFGAGVVLLLIYFILIFKP
jgi:NADH-quinone oxidoreductase subunit L